MNIYIYGEKSFKKDIYKTLNKFNIKLKLDQHSKIEEITSIGLLKETIKDNPNEIYLIDDSKIIRDNSLSSKIGFLKSKDSIEEKFLRENGIGDLEVNSWDSLGRYILEKLESVSKNNEVEIDEPKQEIKKEIEEKLQEEEKINKKNSLDIIDEDIDNDILNNDISLPNEKDELDLDSLDEEINSSLLDNLDDEDIDLSLLDNLDLEDENQMGASTPSLEDENNMGASSPSLDDVDNSSSTEDDFLNEFEFGAMDMDEDDSSNNMDDLLNMEIGDNENLEIDDLLELNIEEDEKEKDKEEEKKEIIEEIIEEELPIETSEIKKDTFSIDELSVKTDIIEELEEINITSEPIENINFDFSSLDDITEPQMLNALSGKPIENSNPKKASLSLNSNSMGDIQKLLEELMKNKELEINIKIKE